MKKIGLYIGLLIATLATTLTLTSCEDEDTVQSMVLSGEWEGDFRMSYVDNYNRVWYADNTYLQFIPAYKRATRGEGYQSDYYRRGPYEYIDYHFRWDIYNGYIRLRYDDGYVIDIYDYRMNNNFFSGYLGDSREYFNLRKLSNFYNWTPCYDSCAGAGYGYRPYYDYYAKSRATGVDVQSDSTSAPAIIMRGINTEKGLIPMKKQ